MRYELKLVCQAAAYERVRTLLRLHPAGLRPHYPTRTVQSVYLDTHAGSALEQNRSGASRRDKLRVRWYGEDADVVQGTLERKVRENQLGWKETVALSGPLRVDKTPRREFLGELTRRVPADWRARIEHGLEPVQWIAYRRDYQITADGRVRVTLDRALRAWDQRVCARLSRAQPTPLPRLLVIEVKAHQGDHELARRIVERFSIPVDRCSKFVLASDRAHGPHPSIFPI